MTLSGRCRYSRGMISVAALVVMVSINGHGPYRFLVDTGAASCVLDPALSRELGLRPEYRVEVVTPTGSAVVPVARAAIGVEEREAELEVLLYSPRDARVRGVLGQSFLSRHNYWLDSRRGRIEWGGEAPPGRRVPLTMIEGRPAITAEPEGRLILDSGASHVVLFHSTAGTEGRFHIETLAGKGYARLRRIPRLRVGDQVLSSLDAAIVDGRERTEDGLLPTSLFEGVYVNNRESYVVLNPVAGKPASACCAAKSGSPARSRGSKRKVSRNWPA